MAESNQFSDEDQVMRIRMRHKAALDAGMSNAEASAYANDPNSPLLSLLSSAQVQSSTTTASSGNSGAARSISADDTGRHELDADRLQTKNSGLPESRNDRQPSDATTDYALSDSRGPDGKFKKGHPKLGGRQKGQRNKRKIVDDVLNEPVTVRQGKRSRKVTKFEAMITRTVDAAVLGNPKSLSATIGVMRDFKLMDEAHETTSAEPVTGDDAAVIADFLRRHAKHADESPKVGNAEHRSKDKETKS